MIFDAHCHIGEDVVFDQRTTEEELMENFNRYGIHGGLVQPYIPRPYVEEFQKIHDRIYQMTRKYPGKIFGMASMNPHFSREDYDRETRRCVRELHFAAIKITPPGHGISPCSADGMHVFELARELQVPVMVHTGMGIPFADPAKLWPCAEAFPQVPIVVAHAGANFYTQQALWLAKTYENIYLEPSGCGIEAICDMLKAVGPTRVMFSTDVRLQTGEALEKFWDLHWRGILSDQGLEQVMYKTAAEVFKLNLSQ
ncbi:MAG TPA: amidohydrolase family protein [Candidatus Egerieimonas intestinavium]|uniref:Amidohydrolase family protein n=1 Tax=Candidatus Egerieimonas intestinavium TaxID=2840777 RepID=A0A9D1EID6_9FIRM|nr:amidohydrolase family protein [Candidatus Egerieimonas intestinavium]